MRRFSETTIEIAAPDLEEGIVDKVYVNINQLGINMKKEAELKDKVASVTLTAKETSSLAAGPVFLQIEAIASDGKTIQSEVIRYSITDSIKSEVRIC